MNSRLERHKKIQIVKAKTIPEDPSSNSHHEETSINAEGIISSKKWAEIQNQAVANDLKR